MKLCYKIWLETSGKAFGKGPFEILYLIDKLGSLNKAAKELHMSYSHAWNLIKILEKRLGFKLLQREVGGNSGGGSFLTKDACELMKKYELFMQEADSSLKLLFQKYFG